MTSCLKATLNPNKQVTYTLASRGHVLVMAETFRLTSDPSYLTLGPVQKRILRQIVGVAQCKVNIAMSTIWCKIFLK